MRVAQLIDSLEAGGAEKMAVAYANALAGEIDFSALIATRAEGNLTKSIASGVKYLFLNKRSTFDFKAVSALRKFVKQNEITILHAHGTSFFIAAMLKISCPQIKIVWHEHYGARASETLLNNLPLFFCARFFSVVLVVNRQLENRMRKILRKRKVYFIPNFAVFEDKSASTKLEGQNGKRIVFLANLKSPKNHLAVLKAFNDIGDTEWSLHLIGQNFNDDYSAELEGFIAINNLQNRIWLYGAKTDIENILSQASVGILASVSEGFPVTILEYGLKKLAVVCTNAGFCPEIIIDNINGFLFDPADISEILEKLQKIISDENIRQSFGVNLQQSVLRRYSEKSVIAQLLSKYNGL